MKLQLIRDVTRKECDWVCRTYKTGEIMYKYKGPTYGCVSHDGIACTIEDGKLPFFELPRDSVVSVTTKLSKNERIYAEFLTGRQKEDIAKTFNLSTERIRQIIREGINISKQQKDYGQSNVKTAQGNIVHQKLEDQIKNTNIFIAHLEGQSALTISKSYSMTEIQVGEIIQKEAARTAAELSESMLKLDESEIPVFMSDDDIDSFNASALDIVQKEKEENHRKLIDQYPITTDQAFPGPDRNKPPLHGSLGKDPYPHREFNNMIIRNVAELRKTTADLKINSPYYPEYLRKQIDDVIYFSTLVRIDRNHVWYAVHHMRSFEIYNNSSIKIMTLEMDTLKMLRFEIHKSSVCYKANPDDKDSSQQSEYDRLTVDDK